MDRVVRLLLVVLLDREHLAVRWHLVVQIHPFDPVLLFDLVGQFHLLVLDNHVDHLYPVDLVVLGIRVALVDPVVPENIPVTQATNVFLTYRVTWWSTFWFSRVEISKSMIKCSQTIFKFADSWTIVRTVTTKFDNAF